MNEFNEVVPKILVLHGYVSQPYNDVLVGVPPKPPHIFLEHSQGTCGRWCGHDLNCRVHSRRITLNAHVSVRKGHRTRRVPVTMFVDTFKPALASFCLVIFAFSLSIYRGGATMSRVDSKKETRIQAHIHDVPLI